ncbi:hypothetical protein [Acinetobacter sp. A47]|uniref:hypothetical protein n=1 Tax=Acinetobacter sp. A47 TaxID=1561217 RepID=UPI00056DD07A|nr:hypothetical protein [Acinetobacter sp. A47]
MKQTNDLGTPTGSTNPDGTIDPEPVVDWVSDEEKRHPTKLHGVPVWLHLDQCFDAAVMYKCNTYERGTVLHTAHPREWTNATIVEVLPYADKDLPPLFKILTDIGNYMYHSENALKHMYLPPDRRRVASGEKLDWSQVL